MLGARIIDDEVVSIEKDVNFKVHCVNDSYEARTVFWQQAPCYKSSG